MRRQMLRGWHCIARRRRRRIRARYRWNGINTWAQRASIRSATLISIGPVARVTVCVIRLNHHAVSGVGWVAGFWGKFNNEFTRQWTKCSLLAHHSDPWSCRCNENHRCRAWTRDCMALGRWARSPSGVRWSQPVRSGANGTGTH
jgi:hypothetical protein